MGILRAVPGGNTEFNTDRMKILILCLLLFSCQKEKTECLCRNQIWKKGVFNSPGDPLDGKQTLTFYKYSPYYHTECNKGGKWYDMDSTVRFFLICE